MSPFLSATDLYLHCIFLYYKECIILKPVFWIQGSQSPGDIFARPWVPWNTCRIFQLCNNTLRLFKMSITFRFFSLHPQIQFQMNNSTQCYVNNDAWSYWNPCQSWAESQGDQAVECPCSPATSTQHRWEHVRGLPQRTLHYPSRTSGSKLNWTRPLLPGLLCKLEKVPQGSFLAPWVHSMTTEMWPEFQFSKAPLGWALLCNTNCTVGFGIRQFKNETKLNTSFHMTSLLRTRGDYCKMTWLHWFYF